MTKKDIVAQVARETKVKQREVRKVVQRVFDVITESLIKGETVELRNFGIFKVKQRKGRTGRNPKTGVEVPVPPRRVVAFKAGLEMKKRVR